MTADEHHTALGELAPVSSYYTERLRRHGPTPLGVDWPHRLNQELRFVQLLKVCDFSAPIVLNDVGCGYGALLGYLWRRHRQVSVHYQGSDISAAMVAAARRRWRHRSGVHFEHAAGCRADADFSIASGIFNVKLDCETVAWESLIQHTLRSMQRHSRRGFSVNFILPPVAGRSSPPQLYRPEPARWTAWIEVELQWQTTLLKDYGLPEFTLLARPWH